MHPDDFQLLNELAAAGHWDLFLLLLEETGFLNATPMRPNGLIDP